MDGNVYPIGFQDNTQMTLTDALNFILVQTIKFKILLNTGIKYNVNNNYVVRIPIDETVSSVLAVFFGCDLTIRVTDNRGICTYLFTDYNSDEN